MDAKVVDAEVVENNKDHWEGLDDFNFADVLEKESGYAFVKQAIECVNDNEVVLDLWGKYCIHKQEHHEGENSTNILLDNQSTVYMIVNSKFLKNDRVSIQVLRLYTNAGMAKVMHEGDIPGVGVCWYYADGIANVIS